MAGTQDCSLGISIPETVYGTPVVTTRWYEYLDESLDYRKNIKQGQGLRVGGRIARGGRRVVPTADGGGDFSMEVASKGMGLLWSLLVGAGTSSLVSGATYQQNFTDSDVPGSTTLQKGLPRLDGTVDAYTFPGAMCTNWDLTFANADILKLKAGIDAKDVLTATAYAAPSYPVAPVNLFHFAGGSVGTGVFVPPTISTLATAATPVADVRGGNVAVNNSLKIDRYLMGSAGRKSKPTSGLAAVTGSLDIEYDSTTFRDAMMSDSPMSLLLTWTAGALGVGLETIQIGIPELRFDSPLPMTNGTDLIVQSMKFQGLDGLVAPQGLYVSCRTGDIAL